MPKSETVPRPSIDELLAIKDKKALLKKMREMMYYFCDYDAEYRHLLYQIADTEQTRAMLDKDDEYFAWQEILVKLDEIRRLEDCARFSDTADD